MDVVIFVNFTWFSTDINEFEDLVETFEEMKKIVMSGFIIVLLSSCTRVECSYFHFHLPSVSSIFSVFHVSEFGLYHGGDIIGDPQGQPKPITKSIIHDQEGVVEVIMKVSDDGQWKLVNLSATNEDLAKYVVSKLKEYQKQTPSKAIGQVVKYRFVFKQQT